MNILFVFREDIHTKNFLIRAQMESLKREGKNVSSFVLNKGGAKNYIINIFKLHKHIKQKNIDIVHAHYSLCGIISALATTKPICISFMGSDLNVSLIGKTILKLFSKLFWKSIIVKSLRMYKNLRIKKALIIPNGVDFKKFYPYNKELAKKKVGFQNDKNIIWIAVNPDAKEKNLSLAKQALKELNSKDIVFHIISQVDHSQLIHYYNAADVLLLTSLSEGSPNVIKEAMACNLPIVSTDVGNVRELISNINGCFITDFESSDVSEKIKKALLYKSRTNGRNQIKHLETKLIANKIIDLYNQIK